MTAVVYRMYDANCVLLYIGKSCRLPARLAGHQSRTPFFGEVDTISVEHFATKEEAARAEREAIAAEAPRYNVQNNRGRGVKINRHEGFTPPADGLRVNPAFLDFVIAHREATIDADLDEYLRAGGGVTLEVAKELAAFFGTRVEALFPNAGPEFIFDGYRFVDADRVAA